MSLRPPLHVSTFHSRTVVSMFGRLCHLLVHALSSLQVANAQCMTLRSLAPCLRAAREKHRFAAGKKQRNAKKHVWQQEKNALQREKAVSAAGKNASKKCRFAAGKNQSSRKNTLQQHKSTSAAEKIHFGGSGKKPSEAGKNLSEARKKPAEAGKKPAAEKVQLCNPKSCRNGKNTFPQREKAAAPSGWTGQLEGEPHRKQQTQHKEKEERVDRPGESQETTGRKKGGEMLVVTDLLQVRNHLSTFFPSNARWLSPGRLSSRKDYCIVQIHRINAVATSVMTTVCMQKRTEKDRSAITCPQADCPPFIWFASARRSCPVDILIRLTILIRVSPEVPWSLLRCPAKEPSCGNAVHASLFSDSAFLSLDWSSRFAPHSFEVCLSGQC